MRLRVLGEGSSGGNGMSGDLYLEIEVKPHKYFTRYGNDIMIEKNISFGKAALGSEIPIRTLNGNTKLKIPKGTQNDHILKIKCKGIPNIHNSERGDILVRIKVDVPTFLTERQIELIKEFEGIKPNEMVLLSTSQIEKSTTAP
ncbi:MAG TPA: hypothetical protein DHV62_00645, partial [Elusimicrobia bacterium]|nr:hypothetical protein [Elusimicrobiota bacterium]